MEANYQSDNKPQKLTYSQIMKLEKITAEIFKNSGYVANNAFLPPDYHVDVIAKNNEKEYFIEVKASSSLQFKNTFFIIKSVEKSISCAREHNAIPVIFIYSVLSHKDKERLNEKYNDLIILDLSNILYTIDGTELRDELIAILPFSVEQIEQEAPSLELGWIQHKDISSTLLIDLDNCPIGKSGATLFENVCFDLLQYIFSDDLSLWQKQEKSNMDLYRFDLLCRIKDNTNKTFWNMAERFFNSKYIIFEFKNYTEMITQKEIYTTEKYLYQKALRNVAVIIARNGYDENSIWASKGCLRENGKLIILLTIDDLKAMVELRKDEQDPSEFLLNKLDELLIELEK